MMNLLLSFLSDTALAFPARSVRLPGAGKRSDSRSHSPSGYQLHLLHSYDRLLDSDLVEVRASAVPLRTVHLHFADIPIVGHDFLAFPSSCAERLCCVFHYCGSDEL